MAPRFSVMMPVYNGATYLREAIDSVLSQTSGDFELLIMDDGSTDGTPAILKRYAEQDRRIRVFLRQHQGQVACRNELLRLATTDIVALADADDICLPDRFEHQLAAMTRDSDLWILGTAAVSTDSKGAHRRPLHVPTGCTVVGAELERRCCIVHASCMMRAKNVRAIGAYRPAYACAEDYDLFLRAKERGKLDNLSIVGMLYRQHGGNVSHQHRLRQVLSTDLARATHALRLAGQPDPTDGRTSPPELDDPLLAALIPPLQMELYRATALALSPKATAGEIGWAAELLLRARVGKKQARVAQQAMVDLISRRRFDRVSIRLALRAAAMGPGRLARLLLASSSRRRAADASDQVIH